MTHSPDAAREFPKALFRASITAAGRAEFEHSTAATRGEEAHATADGWVATQEAAVDAATQAYHDQQARARWVADRRFVERLKRRWSLDQQAALELEATRAPAPVAVPVTPSRARPTGAATRKKEPPHETRPQRRTHR